MGVLGRSVACSERILGRAEDWVHISMRDSVVAELVFGRLVGSRLAGHNESWLAMVVFMAISKAGCKSC